MASSDHYDKITIEQRILNDPTLPGTILRLPTVYGPSDNQHRLFPILKCIYDKRSHILIEASGKIYNVSEEQTYTEAEWTQKIASATGWQGEVVILSETQMPDHLVDEANWEQRLVTDSQRIRTEPGYTEIVPPDDGLQKTIEWERANPPG